MTERLTDADRPAVAHFISQHWQTPHVCIKGALYHPHQAEGFLVRSEQALVGLVTFQETGDELLMITLNSLESGMGIGSSLVLQVIEEARRRELQRVWLVTTNDNLRAMGFYQRMGFRLVTIHRGAIDNARQTIKPELPETGCHGLPIHDEVEMELILKPYID